MNTLQKRFLLFLIGCIGIRSLFVYIAKNVNTQLLMYMGYLALIPAIGFFYIYLSGTRQTGVEVFEISLKYGCLLVSLPILYAILHTMNAVSSILVERISEKPL